jgi:phosphopantetheinyl transferase
VPIFFQHQINENTRLGVWKIEETEEFFKGNVPQHREVTHPHKRLQHLAGRFLLQFLFPDFPYHLIEIADTRKPFLQDEQYHFSISHCGDYAAAIVSSKNRVGVDVEEPKERILKIVDKFLSKTEQAIFNYRLMTHDSRLTTLLWSAKESVFKWYGNGGVDFKQDIQLHSLRVGNEFSTLNAKFIKTENDLVIDYCEFENITLTWLVSPV